MHDNNIMIVPVHFIIATFLAGQLSRKVREWHMSLFLSLYTV